MTCLDSLTSHKLARGLAVSAQIDVTRTIGFRHILEECVSILQGDEIHESRREFVLETLASLFEEAVQGSNLLEEGALCLSSRENDAFATLSRLDQFLEITSNPDGTSRLTKAAEVLRDVQNGKQVPEARADSIIETLSGMIQRVRSRSYSSIPETPKGFSYATL